MKGLAMTQTLNRYLILLTMLFVIAASYGCAELGLTVPQTPQQRIAAGYSTADSINQATTQLLNQKRIRSDDAQHVLNSTRSARQGFDIARKLEPLDPNAANAKIAAQLQILNALQAYLREKESR